MAAVAVQDVDVVSSAALVGGRSSSRRDLHWVPAGLILFGFAAPSSITGVAYTFAHGGLALGTVCCLVMTAASATGALFVLETFIACPDRAHIHMLSDIGQRVFGPVGATCLLVLQMLGRGRTHGGGGCGVGGGKHA